MEGPHPFPTFLNRSLEESGEEYQWFLRNASYSLPLKASGQSGVFDTVEVSYKIGGSANQTKHVWTVYRTLNCPLFGTLSASVEATAYDCAVCSPDDKYLCPGGNRMWVDQGMCVVVDKNTKNPTARDCVPQNACRGTSFQDAGPTTWPYAVDCNNGYAQRNKGDTCCSGCAKGYKNIGHDCAPIPNWEGTSAWEAIFLMIVLSGMAVTFYVSRNQSLFLFPVFLTSMRSIQAVSMVVLQIEDSCAWGAGFAFEEAIYPAFSMTLDFYHEPAVATHRFFGQFFFTGVYLLPLALTSVVQFVKQRSGRLALNDATPLVAFKRAVTAWVWIAFLPLLFVATSQLACTGSPKVMFNYPISACSGSDHAATVFFSTALLVLVAIVLFVFVRGVRRLALQQESSDGPSSAGSEEDFHSLAFIYGNCQQGRPDAWLLEFGAPAAVLAARSVLVTSAVAGAVIGTLLVLPLIAYVAVTRPFRHATTNASFIVAHCALLMAFWVHYSRSCAAHGARISGPGLDALSVITILFLLASIALGAVSAWLTRTDKGILVYNPSSGTSYGSITDTPSKKAKRPRIADIEDKNHSAIDDGHL